MGSSFSEPRTGKLPRPAPSLPYDPALPILASPASSLPFCAALGSRPRGVGDVGSLRELIDWAAAAASGSSSFFHQRNRARSLPLHGRELLRHRAHHPGDVTPALPGLPRRLSMPCSAPWTCSGSALGAVAYSLVKSLKRMLLERAFETSAAPISPGTPRARAFRAWTSPRPSLAGRLRPLPLPHGREPGDESWDRWPLKQQDLHLRRLARRALRRRRASAREAHPLLQMGAMGRLCPMAKKLKARREEREVALMGDVPRHLLLFVGCLHRAGTLRSPVERRSAPGAGLPG